MNGTDLCGKGPMSLGKGKRGRRYRPSQTKCEYRRNTRDRGFSRMFKFVCIRRNFREDHVNG